MLAGVRTHLFNFGRGDIAGEYPANTAAFVMNFEHDSRRLFSIHAKKTLQDRDYKIHGRVIVVQQQHLVHLWRLGPGTLCVEQTPFLRLRSHAFDSIQSGSMRNMQLIVGIVRHCPDIKQFSCPSHAALRHRNLLTPI